MIIKMRFISLGLGAGFLALVISAHAQSAPACMCTNHSDRRFSSPGDGAVGVSTNVRIFVSWEGFSSGTLVLRNLDAPDDPVPFHVEEAGMDLSYQAWVVPESDLASHTRYEISDTSPDYLPEVVQFETGAGPDTQPPVLESAIVTRPMVVNHPACVSTIHADAWLDVQGLEDDVTPAGQLVLRVAVVDSENEQTDHVVFLINHSDMNFCFDGFPENEIGSTRRVDVTAFDWASNPSTPVSSDPFDWSPSYFSGCGGCRTSGVAGINLEGLLVLLILIVPWLARHSRSRPCDA